MNRDRFMNELEALLYDISAEERAEALQYYSDYFADAGIENEQKVIEELVSPKKVAETIKAGLSGNAEAYQEYRETGYADTRFETKDMPGNRGAAYDSGYHPGAGEKKNRSAAWKVLLILAIILFGLPIALPLGIGVLALVGGILIGIVALFAAIVIVSAAAAVAGAALFIAGVALVLPNAPVGLLFMGIGLIIGALGVVATVLCVRIGFVCFRALFRMLVDLCRRPFHRKAV